MRSFIVWLGIRILAVDAAVEGKELRGVSPVKREAVGDALQVEGPRRRWRRAALAPVYDPVMSRRSGDRTRSDEAVKSYLAKLTRDRRLVTYGDEAEALFSDRLHYARAVGQIHARLSREVGGRYPGTEWVVTDRGEVVGPFTRGGAVEALRNAQVEVIERDGRFFVDRKLIRSGHRR
jgi:hypothetical protein